MRFANVQINVGARIVDKFKSFSLVVVSKCFVGNNFGRNDTLLKALKNDSLRQCHKINQSKHFDAMQTA